jgi:hypothetical protein
VRLIIRERRIRNSDRYLGFLENNSNIIIGVIIDQNNIKKLIEIGFPEDVNIGDSVLPSVNLGRINERAMLQ